MQIVDTRPPQAKQENRIFRAIGCTAVYLTSAGALCSMAGLGRTLLGAWGAGTVLLLALCFLPKQTSVYKGYKQDKIEMRGDRAEMSDFPLYLNTVAGGLDCRDQTIGGFSFVVKIYALPVVEIIG